MATMEELQALSAAVKDAKASLSNAEAALRTALNDTYGLIGRVVNDRGRFRITSVTYSDLRPWQVTGPKIKKDGSLSQMSGYAYVNRATGTVPGLEPLDPPAKATGDA